MNAFTFSSCKHVVCEFGAAAKLADHCYLEVESAQSALLITDSQLLELGLHTNAVQSLQRAGLEVAIFGDVQADPSEQVVLEAVARAKDVNADLILGFGGGSSMDVAKVVALLASPNCTQPLSDLYGVGKAKGERLPLIQIPTTAGTGSEVTQVSIITTGETTKAGIVTPLFLPDITILDAQLTMGLPPRVTAETGVDAMVHALEAYTCVTRKNPVSDMFAKEALRLMGQNLPTAVKEGQNRAARESMLLGAMLAGQAFANSPVAAVHALAYPLGGHFHIPHGLSNALVLPHVIRFNASACAGQYADLAELAFPNTDFVGSDVDIAEQLATEFERLIKYLGLPSALEELGIPEDFLSTLAKDAILQTRLLVNNPKTVDESDALAIYQAAYK